ncbi:MAG: CopD family protein [Gammaproteobacteria bacterium]|nr:CopD family protein [Gammaproteobacteria bacterium]
MWVAIALLVHLLAAMIWIGGMFFAYMVVRPMAVQFDPPVRLNVWAGVFKKFFPWVWFSILFLLLSGYALMFGAFNGFAGSPWYVHFMHLLALIMVAVFLHLYFAVYPKFKAHVQAQAWPEAAEKLNSIRRLVSINLIIGILLVAGVMIGKYS